MIDIALVFIVAATVSAITHGNGVREIMVAAVVVYDLGMTMEGGTLGKRLLRLRVVRTSGEPVDAVRCFLREIVGKALSMILFLGYIWPVFTVKHQAWHDKLADTLVVHERVPKTGPEWGSAPPWAERTTTPD